MAIPHNYAPGSKRPWDHDLGNDSADVNAEATTTQSNVAPVEHDIDEIKEVLQNCLDGISTAADRDWAFGGLLLHAVNPGLTLPKSGIVGLPLSPHDVSRIQDEARGGISNTENPNAGYSSCWILSAEQFALRNPAWAKFVKDLVLGTIGSSAGSYQIDLPSMHTGGRLDYTFGADSRTFDTSASSEFDMTYVASYSDVHRSSLPIESGYRLQLEYRIHKPGSPGYEQIETASNLERYAQDFEEMLKDWTALWKANSAPPLLVYILEDDEDDEDEESSPVVPGLSKPGKANDLKAQYLQERCAKQGICAFSVCLRSTIQVSGSDDDNEFMVEDWRSLDGSKVPEVTTSITLDQIIQTDYFKDRESNDSEYGLEDPFEEVDEYHYRDKAFVIMPEEYRTRFARDKTAKRRKKGPKPTI